MSDIWMNFSSVPDEASLTAQKKKKLKQKQKRRKYLERKKNSLKGLCSEWAEPAASTQTKLRLNGAEATPPTNSASCSRPPAPAGRGSKPRPSAHSCSVSAVSATQGQRPQVHAHLPPPSSATSASSVHHTPTPSKTLAIDCEMVGAGVKGHVSQLARCSIVAYDGSVLYDKFIHPPQPVTDYRTRWSGICRSDLDHATPFAEARKEILKLLMGKVVVGHAVHNDFKVLGYGHPSALTRDTSRIPLLNRRAGLPENQVASLKRLTKAIFNRDIQTGRRGHSSVEDAKATMELYRAVEVEWERTLASKATST